MNRILPKADLGFVEFVGGGLSPYESLELINESRPAVILSFVVEGSVQSENAMAGPGSVMVHPPYRLFSEIATGPGLHAWIGFRFATFHPIWSTLRKGGVVQLEMPDEFLASFERLLVVKTPSELSREFFSLLVHVERAIPEHSWGGSHRFQSLCEWIRENTDADLSRATLADRAGMHPNALDRAFRIATGQTLQEYVRSVRLVATKEMLRTSPEPLDSIAMQVGLANGAYLSRWFKLETGLSPSNYRERVKKIRSGYLEI